MTRQRSARSPATLRVLLALFAFTVVVLSARTDEPAPDEGEVDSEPLAITTSEIPVRADELSRRLRAIENGANDAESQRRSIEKGIATIESDHEELKASPLDRERSSVREFEDQRGSWNRMAQSAGRELAKANEAIARLQSLLDELDGLRRQWAETRERTAAEEGVPEELVQRVETLLASIDRLESVLQPRAEALIELSSRASSLRAEADEAMERMDESIERSRSLLLERDSPALWQLLATPPSGTSVLDQLRRSQERNRRALVGFVRSSGESLLLHGLLFAGLLAVTIALRRRVEELSEDRTDLRAAMHVLRRPGSAALLVALLATPIIEAGAPAAVGRVAVVLALVAMLRLVPALIAESLRLPLYGLTAAIALILFNDLLEPLTLPHRLTTLLVTGVALFGFLAARRSWVAESGEIERGTARSRVAALLRLGAVVLGASLFSNLLGRAALAELLARGTILGALFGVLFFAGGAALRAVVGVALETATLRRSNLVREQSVAIRRRADSLLRFGLPIAWLYLTLRVFRIDDPILRSLWDLLAAERGIGGLRFTLGGILAFLMTIVLAILAARLVRLVLESDVLPRMALPRGVPGAISLLTRYALVTLGFLVALRAAGVELSQVTIVLGALGVGIGFGLQNVVNNFISGLILIFERPIQVGDTIQFGTLLGSVRSIGIRSSTVRTFDGAEVIVPNGNLIATEVTNWTLSDRNRRIEIPVGVAYGSDPHRVIELLEATAAGHAATLPYPNPKGLFDGFGDSSLDFRLWAWTSDFDNWVSIRSELTLAIHDALRAAGIEIPFPQRDLHLRSVDEDVRATLSARSSETDPASATPDPRREKKENPE